MAHLNPAEVDGLTELEHSLWRTTTRFDADYMGQVLTDDFLEFGRSGRVYDRRAVSTCRRSRWMCGSST